MTRDEWLDQVLTHRGHSQLPRDQQEEVTTGMGAAIDDLGGRFTM